MIKNYGNIELVTFSVTVWERHCLGYTAIKAQVEIDV